MTTIKNRPLRLFFRSLIYNRSGQQLALLPRPASAKTYGESISCLRDLNGDGKSEIVVGAVRDNTNGDAAGAAFVYDGDSLAVLYSFVGEWQEEFGTDVSGAGDVNGDGIEDVIVGSRGRHLARIYSGEDGSLIHRVDVAPVQVTSVAGVGDINADGFDDFMTSGTFLFSGLTGLIIATFTRDGVVLDGSFGTVLDGPGDLNGDGAPDILIGEPKAQINEQEMGRTYAFFGEPSVATNPDGGSIQPPPDEDNGMGTPPPESDSDSDSGSEPIHCEEFKLRIEVLEAEKDSLRLTCDEEKALLQGEIGLLQLAIGERDLKIEESEANLARCVTEKTALTVQLQDRDAEIHLLQEQVAQLEAELRRQRVRELIRRLPRWLRRWFW